MIISMTGEDGPKIMLAVIIKISIMTNCGIRDIHAI